MLPGAQSHLRPGALFQAPAIVGRIQFVAVVGLRLASSRGHSWKGLRKVNLLLVTDSKSGITRESRQPRKGWITETQDGSLGIMDLFLFLTVGTVSRVK